MYKVFELDRIATPLANHIIYCMLYLYGIALSNELTQQHCPCMSDTFAINRCVAVVLYNIAT